MHFLWKLASKVTAEIVQLRALRAQHLRAGCSLGSTGRTRHQTYSPPHCAPLLYYY